MKKKGFTLIELLAVIVILAIIALIATPIVLNIIKNSKESATIRGAEYYLNAVELAVARNRLESIKLEGTYNILSNGNICNQNNIINEDCNEGKEIIIDVKGETPDRGTVTITNGKITNIGLTYDEKTVTKVDNEFIFLPKPVSFKDDDWSTIIANVKAGNTDAYNVGAEKEITLTGEVAGTYTVRLANKSNPGDVCTKEYIEGTERKYSKTACGFVIEFVDITKTHAMNYSSSNKGGWPASNMYTYVNETIYAALDPVVKEAIIDTTVVSGYESGKSSNYTSTDKLYLLSTKEVYGKAASSDRVSDETRQLDYYKDYENTDGFIGVTTSKYSGAAKNSAWWLRSANSGTTNSFYRVYSSGDYYYYNAYNNYGVAAAFRLG